MHGSLSGRTLCVIGANGYVGSAVARQAINLGVKVYSVNRSGKINSKAPWVDQVTWVKGNAMNPDAFAQVLEESDAVVHTVGTLLDTSITKGKHPGEEGTYEHMNRDTAISVGRKLNELNKNKKIVFLSGSTAPPFIPRYLTTKHEAEAFLLGLENVRASILRPGFITSKDATAKKVLKYPVDIYAGVYNILKKVIPKDTGLETFAKNFEVDRSVDINAVAISALICCFDPKFDGRILYNKDMEELKGFFLERGYEFPAK